jgi:two-component system, OmpR family, response regulator
MRILIIEDDTRVQSFLRRKLEAEGFAVDVAEDGPRGLARALRGPCDLVVLDLLLPRLDGLSVLRELHQECPALPVLVLTARADLATKLRSFELGASDYLSKPFSLEELLARVRVHVHARDPDGSMLVRAGGLVLDVTRRQVQFNDSSVVLSDREFRLLHVLVEHAGEVMSRESLLEAVWGYTFDPGSNVVEVCIRRVRRKLGPLAPIETVHHEGYRLAAA